MKKTYYFQHDYNARNDPKLQAVMIKYGLAGIGAFWCIVEMLYEQDGTLPITSISSIAYTLHADEEMLKNIVCKMDLFECNKKNFWSRSVRKRLGLINEISDIRRKAAEKRWKSSKKSDAKAMQMQCKSNAKAQNNDANAMQTECKCNAIKEKEIKGNDIKDITPTPCARSAREEELFQEFEQMQSAWEEIAMKFGKDIPSLKKILQDFILECRAKGTAHSSISDLRCHFVDWARIQIQQQEKQKQQNERRYKTASERKREANDIAIKRCQASIYERLTNVGGEEQLPI
uniref:Lin1244/Lin1753 domain-containing protein n=1 Tax=Prevotellamassilia timonensis TaxID=1852370 RepID=UPI0040266B0A